MKNRRRKRKLKKSVKITLVLLLVIGLLSYPTYKLLTKEKTPTNETKPNIEEKEKHYELSLIAVGDNLIPVQYIKMLINMPIIMVMISNQ